MTWNSTFMKHSVKILAAIAWALIAVSTSAVLSSVMPAASGLFWEIVLVLGIMLTSVLAATLLVLGGFAIVGLIGVLIIMKEEPEFLQEIINK